MLVSFLLGMTSTSLLLLPSSVLAYIPAAAVNNTGSISRSDSSSMSFVWVQGVYDATISLQLTADVGTSPYFPNEWSSEGIDRGALVHFSEDLVHNNDSSVTPWIAFISCDRNSTTMSLEDDIFTLARDRGAMAALLYSNQSEGCQISEEYINDFEKPLDVFTTHNKNDAIVIEDQFEQHCDPAFQNFAPSLLNTSFQSVTSLLNGTYPTSNTYLVAILTAFNATATVPILRPTASSTSTGSTTSSGGSKPGTSLAMIILYSITGVIAVLFMVVIISGAVRAIRHPERYGPRSGRREQSSYPYNFDDPRYGGGDGFLGEGEVAQTRTGGLARAIVDTFPLIKFVGSKKTRNSVDVRGGGGLSGGDVEPSKKLQGESWEMPSTNEINNDGLRRSHHQQSSSSSYPVDFPSNRGSRDDVRSSYHSTKESLMPSASPSRQGLSDHHEEDEEEDGFVVPVLRSGHAAGRLHRLAGLDEKDDGKDEELQEGEERREAGESCAICLLDFEEGDDLRVLPCEGHHRFHQDCIDNWLLDVSGNCPLCRKDFSLAPTSSSSSLPLTADPPASAVAAGHPLATRISRYLANVRSSRSSQRNDAANATSTTDREGAASARAGMQQASGLSSMLSGGVMR